MTRILKRLVYFSSFVCFVDANLCLFDFILQKFAFARLEYCECNIANFPQVKGLCLWPFLLTSFVNFCLFTPAAFIRGDMSKKFSNLKIKFVRGITPILKLLDEKHNVVDELNIQKWDTDTIQVYILF